MSSGEFRYAAFDGSAKQHGFLWGLNISPTIHPAHVTRDGSNDRQNFKTSLKSIQSWKCQTLTGGKRAAYGVRELSGVSFTRWKTLNGFHIFFREYEDGTIKGFDMRDLNNIRTDQWTARSIISMLLPIKAGHSLHGACSSYDSKGVKWQHLDISGGKKGIKTWGCEP